MTESAGEAGTSLPIRARVTKATTVTPGLVEAVAGLIPQLSSSSPPPSLNELNDLVCDPHSAFFVAHDPETGSLLGILTLVWFRIPTGVRAIIEDVVVDEAARGAGAGAALVQAALDEATRIGVRHVDLTSRPSREAANRLYIRMGFQARSTNVYRYTHL